MRKLARARGLVIVSSTEEAVGEEGAQRRRGPSNPHDREVTGFLKTRLELLAVLIEGLRECDTADDREFQQFVSEATRPNTLGLNQRDLAALLDVTPLTLQRWCRGDYLPFPGPRRHYVSELINLLEARAHALRCGDDEPLASRRQRERLRVADA